MRRLTVPEAAEALGITTDAVRMRISRGTVSSERQAGRVYVLLEDDLTSDASVVSSALVEELRAHLATVQTQLEAEREANRENRRIIAALTQRIPALEAPETPEDPGPTDTPTDRSEAPQAATQEAGERVSWWRRVFGG